MNLPPLSNGMIVFLVIAIITATIAHWRTSKFWLAVVASSISSTAIFYAIALVKSGPLESDEALRALLQCGIIGFIVAIAVGWSAKALRGSISRSA